MAKKRYVLLDADCEVVESGEFSDLEEAQSYFESESDEWGTMYVSVVVSEYVPPSTSKWRKK